MVLGIHLKSMQSIQYFVIFVNTDFSYKKKKNIIFIFLNLKKRIKKKKFQIYNIIHYIPRYNFILSIPT